MRNYANGFKYAIDGSKTEVSIAFLQSFPVFAENGSQTVSSDIQTVGEIILPYSIAKEFAEKLVKSMNGNI